MAVILIAMMSIQSGASLAKSLFPLVGAPGVTALRIALGTLILVVIFKPGGYGLKRSSDCLCFYGLALGGMNYMFYLSIQTIPLGIAVALEFTGPLAVALSSRRPVDFIWVILAVLGLWFLLPLGQSVSQIDLTGAALALGAGHAGRCIFSLASVRAKSTARDGRLRLTNCRRNLCPNRNGTSDRLNMAVVNPAGWSGGCHLYGPALLSGDDRPDAPAHTHFGTLMSMEPALAAISGMIFLGETLTWYKRWRSVPLSRRQWAPP